MELLLISFWIAAYLTRNTVQDVVYKRRGEDPPYLVRQRERAARREARGPLTERGAAGRFFAALWEDAWEDAHDKHSKARARKRQEQEEQQALRDKIDALMDEAVEENKRRDAEKADRDAQRREAWQAIPDSCEACGKNVGKDNLTIAMGDSDLRWVCTDCAKPKSEAQTDPATPDPVVHDDSPYVPGADGNADAEQPPPHLVDYAKHTTCRDCGGEIQVSKDLERPGRWIVRTTHTDENCAQNPERPALSDSQTGKEDATADTTNPAAPGDPNPNDDGATVTQMNDWRQFAASSTTTPEEILSVSGETTNLSAALAYTSGMADTHDQAASSAETSIASLTAGGVTGETLTLLAQAQELEGQAAAAYRAANAELTRHIQVQEAYNANQDAGNKQFVTQD